MLEIKFEKIENRTYNQEVDVRALEHLIYKTGIEFDYCELTNCIFKNSFIIFNHCYCKNCTFDNCRLCFNYSKFRECQSSNSFSHDVSFSTLFIKNLDYSIHLDYSVLGDKSTISSKDYDGWPTIMRNCYLTGDTEVDPDLCYPSYCPSEGSFVGWKALDGFQSYFLIKIEVTENAKRLSSFSGICRCNEVKILSITDIWGDRNKERKRIKKNGLSTIEDIVVGKIIHQDSFNENKFNEYGNGIPFYMDKKQAIGRLDRTFTINRKNNV